MPSQRQRTCVLRSDLERAAKFPDMMPASDLQNQAMTSLQSMEYTGVVQCVLTER